MITIFHWDLPEAVYRRGGWLNPECAQWFADYAAKVVELYSDRVDMFLTFNEPECFVDCAYNNGTHAPFAKLPFDRVLQIMHRVLIANGMAVRAMRKAAKRLIQIGMAVVANTVVPATESKADIKAARYESFNGKGRDLFKTIAFLEPSMMGKYPDCIEKDFGSWFEHSESDMKLIHAPFDFIAFNIYRSIIAAAGKNEGTFITAPEAPSRSEFLGIIPSPRINQTGITLSEVMHLIDKFLHPVFDSLVSGEIYRKKWDARKREWK
jgi:beta-glucosidase